MEELISRGKSLISDNLYIEKKMRLILDWAEEEAKLYSKQGSFLYQLSVQTVAKSLHCLSMRLTVESFKTLPLESLNSHAKKLGNPDLQHYVIFSKNILASSVVINSTVARTEVSYPEVFLLFFYHFNLICDLSLLCRRVRTWSSIFSLIPRTTSP